MSSTKIWRDYDQAALDAQYDQRTLVPNVADYMEHDRIESLRAREELECRIDLCYGSGADEVLDLFPAADPQAPTVVFFHGGAWARLHKDHASYQAQGFVPAGANFVSVNFSLAPAAHLDELIRQCRSAITWLHGEASSLSIDPERFHIAGHSSGAHVAAMMLVTDWTTWDLPSDVINGALLVSGIYDLEPVRLSARNDYLHLDHAAALRSSPLQQLPATLPPVVIGYGENELAEFRRQSADLAMALRRRGDVCHELDVASSNHFGIGEELANIDSPLLQPMFQIMGLPTPNEEP